MSTTHLMLRYSHIAMGTLSLLAGAGAMMLRKGSRPHRLAGDAFVMAMLLMAGTGTIMSIAIDPVMGNVMGGMLTMYMVITAWTTAWREPKRIGAHEYLGMTLGMAIAIAGVVFGLVAASRTPQRLHGYPATFYYVFGGIALLGAALDARMIAVGGFSGSQRTARHLSRMCLAMYMATMSFFIGQARLMPSWIREVRLNLIPVLLVIGALVYWLVTIRLLPVLRRKRLTDAGRARPMVSRHVAPVKASPGVRQERRRLGDMEHV